MRCCVCGGTAFTDRAVLWDKLVEEWGLSPAERAYIDRQQGTTCDGCGSNLRSIVLARATLAAFGSDGPFDAFMSDGAGRDLALLEINEAGTLTRFLSRSAGYRFAAYPEIDIHNMPFEDGAFDLVIHSDTLEHVADPIRALSECRRVLRRGGALAFTIPVVVGRMSRDRAGLPLSFHGDAATLAEDWAVVTEYGADMWSQVIRAGFEAATIHALDYPSALAISARA